MKLKKAKQMAFLENYLGWFKNKPRLYMNYSAMSNLNDLGWVCFLVYF
jgi:hypothetical protein